MTYWTTASTPALGRARQNPGALSAIRLPYRLLGAIQAAGHNSVRLHVQAQVAFYGACVGWRIHATLQLLEAGGAALWYSYRHGLSHSEGDPGLASAGRGASVCVNPGPIILASGVLGRHCRATVIFWQTHEARYILDKTKKDRHRWADFTRAVSM